MLFIVAFLLIPVFNNLFPDKEDNSNSNNSNNQTNIPQVEEEYVEEVYQETIVNEVDTEEEVYDNTPIEQEQFVSVRKPFEGSNNNSNNNYSNNNE